PRQIRYAAVIENALIAIARDAARGGRAGHLHRGFVRRVIEGGERRLTFPARGASEGTDLAVRPTLLRDPVQDVAAILVGAFQPLVTPLRPLRAAVVDDDDGVAVSHQLREEPGGQRLGYLVGGS